MNKEQRLFLSPIIDERLDIAFAQLEKNPDYVEKCRLQSEGHNAIERMLEERLGREEKMRFRLHMEKQTAKECFELDQAYVQGLRDCLKALVFLDGFA